MRRLATTTAALALTSVLLATAAFAADPGGSNAVAVMLIAIGVGVVTIVMLAGFLLVRAPWGRWGLAATTAFGLLLIPDMSSVLAIIGALLGATAVFLLLGPWLRFWTRLLPTPDGPGPIPFALMLVGPVAPIVIGLGGHDAASWIHVIAATVVVSASTAYAKAVPGSVWMLRIVAPAAGLAAAIASPLPWAMVIYLGVAALTVMAWMPSAAAVVATPPPVLPTPVAPSTRRTGSDAPR